MKAVSSSHLWASIALAALALPAVAQEAAVPAAAPAPVTQAPVAAPATPQDAAVADAVVSATRELPQVLPTTGDGALITTLLSGVCEPLIKGGDIKALAKTYKLKEDRKTGEWATVLGAKPYQVSILPPGEANPTICEMKVRYAIGGDQPIVDAVNIWRFLHQPQMVLRRNDAAKWSDVMRVTTTWDNYANQMVDGSMHGLALVQINNLNGAPSLNADYDEIVIQYNVRPPVTPTLESAGSILLPGGVPAATPAPAETVAPATASDEPAADAPAAAPAAAAPATPAQ